MISEYDYMSEKMKTNVRKFNLLSIWIGIIRSFWDIGKQKCNFDLFVTTC